MSNFLNIIKALLNEKEDPMKTTPASIEQGGGDSEQYKREKAKKDPKKTTKSKNLGIPQSLQSIEEPINKKRKKLKTIGKSGGKHRRDGTPVKVSPNHPDYLKRKLYQRSVKAKGYGKKGESKPGMSTDEINKKGVRGHEKEIAKKKSDMRMDMMKQILAARKRRQAKGKSKKLGSGALATIARRAKDKES